MNFYRIIFKPILDRFFALILLIILLPLLVMIYLYVYLTISKTPIFSQFRPGLNQKLFKLIIDRHEEREKARAKNSSLAT